MWLLISTALACQCPALPPLAECAPDLVPASFADTIKADDGAAVTVVATLHALFGCAYRATTDGCTPMCNGQAALVESATSLQPILYLGDASTTGPFACTGSEECWCCAVDARDQLIVATGVLRRSPTLRIEAAKLCRPSPAPAS